MAKFRSRKDGTHYPLSDCTPRNGSEHKFKPESIPDLSTNTGRYMLVGLFREGKDVSNILGEPIEIIKEPRIHYPSGHSEKIGDYLVKYKEGIELIVSHGSFTNTKMVGRLFVTRPIYKSFLTASLIIPNTEASRGNIYSKKRLATDKLMSKFLNKTVRLSVESDVFGLIVSIKRK